MQTNRDVQTVVALSSAGAAGAILVVSLGQFGYTIFWTRPRSSSRDSFLLKLEALSLRYLLSEPSFFSLDNSFKINHPPQTIRTGPPLMKPIFLVLKYRKWIYSKLSLPQNPWCREIYLDSVLFRSSAKHWRSILCSFPFDCTYLKTSLLGFLHYHKIITSVSWTL
jgi:hypothetical protein